MSKAFTRESDSDADEIIPEPKDLLPPGVRNYVTPEGALALRTELERLEELRPQLARGENLPEDGTGASLSPKGRVAALERRIQFLRDRCGNMSIVDPKTQDQDSVHFGATVVVADAEGYEKQYKIVGVDESDPSVGKVSFLSPIARALTSAREGDVVRVELPGGTSELEILSIDYV